MDELLLNVDGRLIRILIDDSRGIEGTLVTLVCKAARNAEVIATPQAEPGHHYPSFPAALRGIVSPNDVSVVVLSVDELPRGCVPFAMGVFAEAASRAAATGVNQVTLTPETAQAWGAELDTTGPEMPVTQ